MSHRSRSASHDARRNADPAPKRAGAGAPPRARQASARGGPKTGAPAARIAVQWRPLDALTPDPNNARVHSERQVARIADSIAAFGFNAPILVDAKGSVLAGHGRLLAARRLGLAEVPTIALDHLDSARRRAFMIADNRLGQLAAWDEGRLAVELKALNGLDLDFSLEATGFELREIDLRIGAIPSPLVGEGQGGGSGQTFQTARRGARDRNAPCDPRPGPPPP